MRHSCFVFALAALSLAACGGHGRPGGPGARAGTIARPLEVYHELGMLAGPDDFAVVARFSTLRGPADSTFLLVSMSMPNSALRFQRDETAFSGEYRVVARVLRDTVQVKQLDTRETIHVASFAETSRTEESIIFQDVLTLEPGRYVVRLQVSDENSARGFQAVDTVDVPAYPREARLATPLLVYRAESRKNASERPALIVNPRNTVAYGGETPSIYLEAYDAAQPQPVELRVVDEEGVAIWAQQTLLSDGSPELRHATIEVPPGSLPIGKLWLELSEAPNATPTRVPLLVTISDQWMVANFEDVLRFLDYIAYPAEVDSLRKATGAERRDRWERFWARRDPLPATAINEFRDRFFERVKIATEQYKEGARAGWETDRGRVYIVLGQPDNYLEHVVGRGGGAQANLIEWLYESLPGGRLVLQFYDRGGFGHYELTQSSEAQFRLVAARIRPGT